MSKPGDSEDMEARKKTFQQIFEDVVDGLDEKWPGVAVIVLYCPEDTNIWGCGSNIPKDATLDVMKSLLEVEAAKKML